jgi:hypothetical protein
MPKDVLTLLEYSLPAEAPELYAERAIGILQQIKQQFPEFYPKFIAPSEVLTLSGVRAFDTYYELGTEAIPKQIDSLRKF